MSSPAQNARSPSARTTDGVHLRVVLHQAPRVADLLAHPAVEGVEHLGPVQRDGGDVVVRRLVADGRELRAGAHRACHSGGRFSTKARRALLGVVGAHHPLAEGLGEDLGLVQRQVEALADGEAGAPHGQRGVAVDEARHLAGPLHQPVVLHDLGNEPELVRPAARCIRSWRPVRASRMAMSVGRTRARRTISRPETSPMLT